MDSLQQLGDLLSAALSWASAWCPVQFLPAGGGGTQIVEVEGSRYKVVRQLGEGGYAVVLLAHELQQQQHQQQQDPRHPSDPVAIKQIFAGSQERLTQALHEVAVLQALSHRNCLPLLGHAVRPCSNGRGHEVLLVCPAFQDGTLHDELDRLALDGGRQLSSRDVLLLFVQLCSAVSHMHQRQFAHFDIKPHNVLIRRPSSTARRRQQQLHTAPSPAAAAAASKGGSSPLRPPAWARHADDDDSGQPLAAAADACDDDGDHDGSSSRVGLLSGSSSSSSGGYQAVLMDFGSARRIPIRIEGRAQALALQEDAEAHCTGTYRAPELFDVPSHCTIDGGVDVWALGCTLYACMYGRSPFQCAIDQGASLALATLNCCIPWPPPPSSSEGAAGTPRRRYPEQLHDLVRLCLQVDPARRPTAAAVLERVQQLLDSDGSCGG